MEATRSGVVPSDATASSNEWDAGVEPSEPWSKQQPHIKVSQGTSCKQSHTYRGKFVFLNVNATSCFCCRWIALSPGEIACRVGQNHVCTVYFAGISLDIWTMCRVRPEPYIYGAYTVILEMTKYTVIYGVNIRFWPTLTIWYGAYHIAWVNPDNEPQAVGQTWDTRHDRTLAVIHLHDRISIALHIRRAGQNLIYTPYMTVCKVISLPKIPYIHRIYL